MIQSAFQWLRLQVAEDRAEPGYWDGNGMTRWLASPTGDRDPVTVVSRECDPAELTTANSTGGLTPPVVATGENSYGCFLVQLIF